MKQTRPIDSITYTSRPRTIDGLTATKQWNWLGVSIPRAGWTDPAEVLDVRAEYSTDGGQTWTLLVGFTAQGGVSNGALESMAMSDATPPAGARIRVTVAAPGKPVTRDLHLFEDDETPSQAEVIRANLRRSL